MNDTDNGMMLKAKYAKSSTCTKCGRSAGHFHQCAPIKHGTKSLPVHPGKTAVKS